MGSSFIAYIDESGDEGFKFLTGSSEWFILSALVLRRPTEMRVVKILDGIKTNLLGKPLPGPLHFRDLDHPARVAYVSELAKHHSHMRAMSIMVHKPSLTDRATFTEKYLLYRYASRFLLERVSWFCRDHRPPNDPDDGSVDVVFSNRKRMSYEDIRTYLDVLRTRDDVKIDWNVINRGQVSSIPHDQRRGLQMVDAIASSYYTALNPNRFGHTEDRYARIIHPLVYSRFGRYKPYGLKVFPNEVEPLIATEDRYAWLRELRAQ